MSETTHGTPPDSATRLSYTTAFIKTDSDMVGTTFFVSDDDKGSYAKTWLVTNKHVLEGCKTATLQVHKKGTKDLQVFTTLRSDWVDHPDGLDLSIISFSTIIQKTGVNPDVLDFTQISLSTVLDNAQLEAQCAGVEQVTLVGYPYGFYDDVHYLPLARRGTTAMPPWVDWKGQPEFLVDIAGFRGNSGGPVLLFDRGSYTDKHGTLRAGEGRLHLLGVFSQVYHAVIDNADMNLGMAIKATAIRSMIAVKSG